jgi:hypothetical protein
LNSRAEIGATSKENLGGGRIDRAPRNNPTFLFPTGNF